MKLKSVKFWNMLGILVGIAIIVVGIVFLVTPAKGDQTAESKSYVFGADYYTYQYEASRNTVQNTAAAANNAAEMGGKLALYAGTLFIVMGVLVTLNYGKRYFLEEDFDFLEDDMELDEDKEFVIEEDTFDEKTAEDGDETTVEDLVENPSEEVAETTEDNQ